MLDLLVVTVAFLELVQRIGIEHWRSSCLMVLDI